MSPTAYARARTHVRTLLPRPARSTEAEWAEPYDHPVEPRSVSRGVVTLLRNRAGPARLGLEPRLFLASFTPLVVKMLNFCVLYPSAKN